MLKLSQAHQLSGNFGNTHPFLVQVQNIQDVEKDKIHDLGLNHCRDGVSTTSSNVE